MIVTQTYYVLRCDFPDCENTAPDAADEYAAWSDPDHCYDTAVDKDWVEAEPIDGTNGKNAWFCDTHPRFWASGFTGENGDIDLEKTLWTNDVAHLGVDTAPWVVLDDLTPNADHEALMVTSMRDLEAWRDRMMNAINGGHHG